jgi:hypothetical protein
MTKIDIAENLAKNFRMLDAADGRRDGIATQDTLEKIARDEEASAELQQIAGWLVGQHQNVFQAIDRADGRRPDGEFSLAGTMSFLKEMRDVAVDRHDVRHVDTIDLAHQLVDSFRVFDAATGSVNGWFDRGNLDEVVRDYLDGDLRISFGDVTTAMALDNQPTSYRHLDGASGSTDGKISLSDLEKYIAEH